MHTTVQGMSTQEEMKGRSRVLSKIQFQERMIMIGEDLMMTGEIMRMKEEDLARMREEGNTIREMVLLISKGNIMLIQERDAALQM